MSEMAKYPYMTRRTGSQNLYYRRAVPKDLLCPERPKQIWKSLGTSDPRSAKEPYAAVDRETERLFSLWKCLDASATSRSHELEQQEDKVLPLSPTLVRRLADEYYVEVYEGDFSWRAELWKSVRADEEGFWNERLLQHPKDDVSVLNGVPYSYYARLMEEPDLGEVFLYCVHSVRKSRLLTLKRDYELGDTSSCESALDRLLNLRDIAVSKSDRSRLARRMLRAHISALQDIVQGYDSAIEPSKECPAPGAKEQGPNRREPTASSEIALFLKERARTNEWPRKTLNRKTAELREFIEIVGDKAIGLYSPSDGILFKDIQLKLPANRLSKHFKNCTLLQAAVRAEELNEAGERVALLSPLTINDKIGTVSIFFDWLKSRHPTILIANPLAELSIKRPKGRRR